MTMPHPDNAPLSVLVVDDVPESLAFLCEALDQAGFTVLVATDGPGALERLRRIEPDVVLLDACMPGMDGFEVCRRIKADGNLSGLPVVFMTGLTEVDHIVAGFNAGGIDYVTKPVQPQELIARLRTHSRNARALRQAREILDVGGYAVIVVAADNSIIWLSQQAQQLLKRFFDLDEAHLPATLAQWLARYGDDDTAAPCLIGQGEQRLMVRSAGRVGLGERVLLLRSQRADSNAVRLQRAALTPRETEVLYWLARGKTNRDIAEICGMRPRTVTKHLEHIFEKLGVETRAAAAVLASGELAERDVVN
jgi:DNA-binding response OmpR family regulator/DNA-binding CsgD family transcriptional regulator